MPSNQTTCTQNKADKVLDGLADGNSLSKVCRDLGNGYNYSTVKNWIKTFGGEGEFFADSARAYEVGYDKIADDCIDIADESGVDVSVDDKGNYTVDGEVIQRSRLRIDTRLRLLGKWNAKKYGDKNIHTGPDGEEPVKVEAITRTIIQPEKQP